MGKKRNKKKGGAGPDAMDVTEGVDRTGGGASAPSEAGEFTQLNASNSTCKLQHLAQDLCFESLPPSVTIARSWGDIRGI